MQPLRSKRKSESGAVIVEFAWVMMPTLGFMFITMTIAWVIFAWSCVQEGVREGARAAVTCTPNTGLTAAIQQTVIANSLGFVTSSNASGVLHVQYFTQPNLALLPVGQQVVNGDIVKISVQGLPVYQFPAILWTPSLLSVGASSADVMSCTSPATP